jgi:bifunctional non-homologous end joining protein LigD
MGKVRSSSTRPGFDFTNEEKVMFPEAGITKGDLLRYYGVIAPLLLPHLKDRPITLERLPDGLTSPKAPHFWQKNTPEHYPDWIPRVNLPTAEGKKVNYVLVNDERTLLYLVNQGSVTFHVNFSRVGKLKRPDFVLFDLDPKEGHFGDVIEIARAIGRRLEAEGEKSFPKTSGKRGVHILAPWRRPGGFDEARGWAMKVVEAISKERPKIATT